MSPLYRERHFIKSRYKKGSTVTIYVMAIFSALTGVSDTNFLTPGVSGCAGFESVIRFWQKFEILAYFLAFCKNIHFFQKW